MTTSMRRATKASVVTLVLALCISVAGCTASTTNLQADDDAREAAPAEGLQAGIDAYNRGDFAEAETMLSAVLGEEPDNVEARKSLALALAAQGKNEEAIEQYREVMDIDPEDHASLYRMAALEMLTGSPEDAAEHLEQAVDLNRDDSYVDELARTYVQLGRYREAAGLWDSLAEDEGRTPEAAAQLLGREAEALRLAGDTDEARQVLLRALELQPRNVDLQAQLQGLGG